MSRVCLISPGHLSTNPRLVKEAMALKDAGFEVSVIHGQFSRWGRDNDIAIAADIGKTASVPFGPTEAPRSVYLRQTILRHMARRLVAAGCSSHLTTEAGYHPIVRDLIARSAAHPADFYIAHDVAALPAAALAAKIHSARFAYDAEDFHLGVLPDTPEHVFEKRLIRIIETRYVSAAAYVTAASPLIAQAYAEAYGIKLPTTIMNVFPKRNGPAAPSASGTTMPGPSIYWFSQTIGPGRGLEIAIQALVVSKARPHLYIRGMPASGFKEQLCGLAVSVGVADQLHFLEPVAPCELEQLGSAYDIGYSGEQAFSENNSRAISNKLFSYVISGIPIVASDTLAHCSMSGAFGMAMEIFRKNDVQSLADSFDKILCDHKRLNDARQHAWQLGQQCFNWEREQKIFVELVQASFPQKQRSHEESY